MKTLFSTVVDGIEDNNEINDAKWSDWDNASHSIGVYGENYTGDATDDAEMALTIECLDAIIASNGDRRDEMVSKFNKKIWGTDFYTQSAPALV